MKKILKAITVLVVIVILYIIFYNLKEPILRKIYIIEYQEYVEKYSEEYNVDKYLIYAIIKAESNFKEDANSSKGAKGLMQIMDSTAEDIAKNSNIKLNENDIIKPDVNINLGTNYISMLMQKYENIELALAAYNAGSGNVDNWIKDGVLKDDGSNYENIPFKETNNYVRKILKDYEIYIKLYN